MSRTPHPDRPVLARPSPLGDAEALAYLSDQPELLEPGFQFVDGPLPLPGEGSLCALGRDARRRPVFVEVLSTPDGSAAASILERQRWMVENLPRLRSLHRLERESCRCVFVITDRPSPRLARCLSQIAGMEACFFVLESFRAEGIPAPLLLLSSPRTGHGEEQISEGGLRAADVGGMDRASTAFDWSIEPSELARLSEEASLTADELEAMMRIL
jgi:hypothetical protein